MILLRSNDINNGVLGEDIIANVSQCCKIVHGLSPAVVFVCFSIIKVPQKGGKWELIDRLNLAIRLRLSVGDLYVETNDVFFSDRLPMNRFFVRVDCIFNKRVIRCALDLCMATHL